MPRTTDTEFLRRRHRLAVVYEWLSDLLEALTTRQRAALLAYYCPHEQLTDDQALAHRREVGERHPSLPQRAGKAAAQLDRLFAELKTSLNERSDPVVTDLQFYCRSVPTRQSPMCRTLLTR